MSEAHKILGQVRPAAAVLTDLGTVPAGKSWVGSSLVVCNTATVPTTFRVAVAPLGASDALAHYIWYDEVIPANKTWVFTFGPTFTATDKIRVYATLATVNFTLFGVEVTP